MSTKEQQNKSILASFNPYQGKQEKEKPSRGPRPVTLGWDTLEALEELKNIRNWKEFATVCEAQKRKRGW